MTPVTITYLEMCSAAELKPKGSVDPRFGIREATVKQWELNRFLYFLVGRDWHWTEKRQWPDQRWKDYAESDGLWTFVACFDGSVAGYYEMRRDDQGGVEIAILGLTPKFVGRGFGGPLLTRALTDAWRLQPTRVWLHTCTLDHPGALSNYLARGMKIYRVVRTEVA
jgi:GNAT superfamily N-acetyltransferase